MGLRDSVIIGLDYWKRPTPHPVAFDVTFSTDFSQACKTDDLHYSLNYLTISTKISQFLQKNRLRNFSSLGGVANAVHNLLEQEQGVCSEMRVCASAPKIDIRAPISYGTTSGAAGTYRIHGLRALALIGIFTFERLRRQYVSLEIALEVPLAHLDVGKVSESVQNYVEATNFKTVEALVKLACQWIFQNFTAVDRASVRVCKPHAIVYTDSVGVSCEYKRAELASEPPITMDASKHDQDASFNLPVAATSDYAGTHDVYVAFGSNEDAPLRNIAQALSLLEQHPQITIEQTLALYMSKPMYHLDQADFCNGVVKLSVRDMSPHALLDVLKEIEYERLLRVKKLANGPRIIDLDLILFGRATITSERLVVPHKAMLDRTFVLQPLCELLPPDFVHPVTAEPVHDHLARLLRLLVDHTVQKSSELIQLVPTAHGRRLEFRSNQQSPTVLMSVFNATPDLFSDGGRRYNLDRQTIVDMARTMKRQGARIIDVGGVSTRPGSTAPSADDEIARVVRVVEAIRLDPALDDIFVSIDTYRACVAEKAVAAGADIVNDISMGFFDPAMFAFVAKSGCGYVMNHMRGTPATMGGLTDFNASPDDNSVEYFVDAHLGDLPPLDDAVQALLTGVSRELASQLQAAFSQGVRRWQIIIDPGVGFAKNTRQNLALVRHCSRVKRYSRWDPDLQAYVSLRGLAMLVGTSRKRFLGEITDIPVASDRAVPTAASVVACVEQGVDIVRVHDLDEVRQAVQVADALYRG